MNAERAGFRRALECLLGVPSTAGNEVEVLLSGDQTLTAMLEAINEARATVDVQTYGHWSGSTGRTFSEALAERARAGVRVRVLLDALGTARIDKDLLGDLEAAGAHVERFRPLANWRVTQSTHRGHRRTLVCDGRVAFAGGWAFADEWAVGTNGQPPWRDTALRLRGPVVNGVRGVFVNNWAEVALPFFDEEVDCFPGQEAAGPSDAMVIRGDAETGWGDMATSVRVLLGLAERRVRISADYFVPDPDALELLCGAAARGVAVEVLRPGPRAANQLTQLASRAGYETLLAAGVRIWEYQPTVLQAKVMTVDGVVGKVGPVEFDAHSLTLNDEVTVAVFDPSVVGRLDDQFDAYLDESEPIALEAWRRRGRAQRVSQSAAGVLARRL